MIITGVQCRMSRYTILSYTHVFLIFTMLIFSGLTSLVAYQKAYFQAAAQTMTSPDLAKVLVDSAIQALQNGPLTHQLKQDLSN